jgi:hypothetical protein
MPLEFMYTAPMLKRLLMIWLIISTLGYGVVWAFDGHVDELNEHRNVVDDVGHPPDGDGDNLSCDHCCHASAHITALCPALIGMHCDNIATGSTPYQQSIFFHSITPPDRPPQS